MDERLRRRCELFIQNRDIIKKQISWQNAMLYPICANIYTQRGQLIDCERIKACRKMIKHNTGFFSNFRGLSELVNATLLSVEQFPEEKFAYTLKIYDALTEEFRSSTYLPLTAVMLATTQNNLYNLDAFTKRAKAIFSGIKAQHPLITSSEDCGMVALLALSDRSEGQIITEVQRCYELLKPTFFSANATQALSFVLSLSLEDPKIKCQRAIAIYEHLKDVKCKYGRGLELALLGVLALQDINIDLVGRTLLEINEFLLNSRGFGTFGVGRSQRIMYATMLLMYDMTDREQNTTMNTAAITSVTSIMIAQQVAICAAAASAAAANSANN